MNDFKVRIEPKNTNVETLLVALQQRFSLACNFIADIANAGKTGGRIQLHHLAYRPARQAFPELGSQLISNAIYAVSKRTKDKAAKKTEALCFSEFDPVYFDRHTLSVKERKLSILTLDGRIKVEGSLPMQFLHLFETRQLKEVQLARDDQGFYLLFVFNEIKIASLSAEQIAETA